MSRSQESIDDCGCKGIRTCRLCEERKADLAGLRKLNINGQLKKIHHYCKHCQKAWLAPQGRLDFTGRGQKIFSKPCDEHATSPAFLDFPGIIVVENFVTEDEESSLWREIQRSQFVKSQSGRRKQDFGPKVNFKKQKLKTGNFTGLPSYSRMLYERMRKEVAGLADLEPVEMCNLEYSRKRGAHIEPHYDDSWLWGRRLVTVNLLSDSALSFTKESDVDVEVRVDLPRFSLIVVTSDARYKWKHGIHEEDIHDLRLAITFRELSELFSKGGERSQEGADLVKVALSFQGQAVGS